MTTDKPVRAGTQARRQRLVELLTSADPVDIDSLAADLEVSGSTIRRDLAQLERDGQVLRVLGGAVGRRADQTWHDKERQHADAKRRIAARACEFVPPHGLVFLDAGTTTAAVAAALACRSDLTLATVGLPSLFNVADGDAEVVVIGGHLHQRGGRFVGALTHHMLDLISPNVAFLGADCLDPVRGLNCPDADIAELKMHIIAISQSSWVLLDRSKLTDQHRHQYWAPLPRSVGFIVEQPLPAQQPILDALTARGHRVVLA